MYTRTLFEKEEELLQPQVEEIGEYSFMIQTFVAVSKMKVKQTTKRAMFPLQNVLLVYSVA